MYGKTNLKSKFTVLNTGTISFSKLVNKYNFQKVNFFVESGDQEKQTVVKSNSAFYNI